MSRRTGLPGARAAVQNALRSGGRVAFPPALGEPDLATQLSAQLPDRDDVEVLHSYRTHPGELRVPPHVKVRSLFGDRGGRGTYVPFRAGRLPDAIRPGGELPVDVALVRLSPPDAQGMHSVGPSATSTRPLVESARLVIAEIDPELPRTGGPGASVPTTWVDVVVDAVGPLHRPKPGKPVPRTEIDAVVGHLIPVVPDGATVQVGVGRRAQAGLAALHGRDDVEFVCGLLSAPMVDFIERANVRSDTSISVGEAIGGPELMDYINCNPRLHFETSATIHNARELSNRSRFVTINSVLEVDMFGQVNCEAIGHRVVGGLGGLPDFHQAATLSPGGFNVVIVPSDPRGRPRIVERLSSPLISAGRTNIDYVVSALGVADLRGASIDETRARLLAISGSDRPHQAEAPPCHGSSGG